MTVGEKFADALAAYVSGTDYKIFPSMLHDDFHWESWTEIKMGLQVETKETTLELFSNPTPNETSKVFLATDDILVVGYRAAAYGSILFTYEFQDGVAVRAFSARGEHLNCESCTVGQSTSKHLLDNPD